MTSPHSHCPSTPRYPVHRPSPRLAVLHTQRSSHSCSLHCQTHRGNVRYFQSLPQQTVARAHTEVPSSSTTLDRHPSSNPRCPAHYPSSQLLSFRTRRVSGSDRCSMIGGDSSLIHYPQTPLHIADALPHKSTSRVLPVREMATNTRQM